MDPAESRPARREVGIGRGVLRRLLAAGLAVTALPAGAISFPGDTWGRVAHDLNIDTGTGASSFVNQGIEWFELPGEIAVTTFAEYRYAKRTKERLYFDASGPGIGLNFRRRPFNFGVEEVWERYSEQGTTIDTTRLYLTWYHDWYKYMRRRISEDEGGWIRMQALSGNTWGRVRHEFDELEATSVSFFVNQGIDWFDLPGEITFNTFAEARFSYRSKEPLYYNTYGPALGMELQRSPFRLGTDYYWERYTERDLTVRTWRVYLTWYYNWDLKNLAD